MLESVDNEINMGAATQVIREFAGDRSDAVRRGLESPELAALMVEKYAEGIWRLLDDSSVIELADILCVEIDPGYKANRELRYSKYAQLDLSVDRKSRASMN